MGQAEAAFPVAIACYCRVMGRVFSVSLCSVDDTDITSSCRLPSGAPGAISPLPPDITGVCCQLPSPPDAGALRPAAQRTADTAPGVHVAHGIAQQTAPTTHLIARFTPAATEEQRESAKRRRERTAGVTRDNCEVSLADQRASRVGSPSRPR
ncbi:unnamed protein product [Arctogadus glacialis]